MRILKRDLYTCRECGKRGATDVDHDVPVAEGGTSDDSNLVTLCGPRSGPGSCHARKSTAEGNRAKARRA
jgi:5-methylcytosine-specific restriction enzyme A